MTTATLHDPLTVWCHAALVNRLDVWGGYGKNGPLTLPAVKDRGRVRLDDHVLRDHFAGRRSIGLHAISENNTCKWIAFDVDAHSSAADPDENWRIVERVVDQLVKLDVMPIIEDSNGRGGYHVWVLWSEPIPAELAYRFAKWIKGRAGAPEIESFPKQPNIGPERKYGNWLRIFGRHHRRDHWSRIYDQDSETWLCGGGAVAALLSATRNDQALLDDVLPILPRLEPTRPPVWLRVVRPATSPNGCATTVAEPVCIRDLLKHGIRRCGDRNKALLTLARFWKAVGFDQAEAVARGAEFVRNIPASMTTANLTVAEIITNVTSVVQAVYNGTYPFACWHALTLGTGVDPIACDAPFCKFVKSEIEIVTNTPAKLKVLPVPAYTEVPLAHVH